MERLTDKRLAIPPGQWQEVTREEARKLKEIPVPPTRELYYRLSQIEDILGDEYDLDRLRELAEADREGRCVVLPCNVGGKLYVIGKSVIECDVMEVYLDDRNELVYLVAFNCNNDCDGCPFKVWRQDQNSGEWGCDGEYGEGIVYESNFGKTVFLTREDAESALAAKEGEKHESI